MAKRVGETLKREMPVDHRPVAAFGAFYFLVSAILLAVKTRQRAETA